jgi:hypothetical protein
MRVSVGLEKATNHFRKYRSNMTDAQLAIGRGMEHSALHLLKEAEYHQGRWWSECEDELRERHPRITEGPGSERA